MQDVNAIPAEVIKQHSLSSCATASHLHKPSSNGKPASSGNDLPSDLQQLNLAPPPGNDTKAVSPHTSEAVEPGTPATAEVPNRPDQCEGSRQNEAAGAILQSVGGGESGAEDQDQACRVTQLAECDAKAEQVGVPAISIAGWDESPVSVRQAAVHLCGLWLV